MNNSNFRPLLMSLLLLVGVAAPVAAIAQAPISNIGSGSTDERLAQLERISNAHSRLLTQLQQQLADSQRDIDMLRGQIQENQYQLNQVVERQRNIYQQLDSLNGGNSAPTTDEGLQRVAMYLQHLIQVRVRRQQVMKKPIITRQLILY